MEKDTKLKTERTNGQSENGSETVELQDEFDLIFTSPPYFDKEKYNQSDMQSYKKYKKFDEWMQNFIFKAIELRTKNQEPEVWWTSSN